MGAAHGSIWVLKSYFAHGGDWGAVGDLLAGAGSSGAVRAIHMTGAPFAARWTSSAVDEQTQTYRAAVEKRYAGETGYQAIHGTKPLSLSYGLTDSPVGLAAWIAEKFHGWTDRGDDDAPPIAMDALLANIMMHWLPGPGPATWIYCFLPEGLSPPDRAKVNAPTGICAFPRDFAVAAPEAWIAEAYNFRRRTFATAGRTFSGARAASVSDRRYPRVFQGVPLGGRST